MLAQALDVLHEVPGGVVDKTRVGSALAASTLIKKDNSVASGIEETAHLGFRAPTGSTVQEDHGLATSIAAFLEIDFVQLRYAQKAFAVGPDCGVEGAAYGLHVNRSSHDWRTSVETVDRSQLDAFVGTYQSVTRSLHLHA